MSGIQSGQQVDQSDGHQYPGIEKMETSPPAILIEDIVCPACADGRMGGLKKGLARCPAMMMIVATDRKLEQRRRQVVPNVSPIHSGVYHQYFHTGIHQEHKADRLYPMFYFDLGVMH